MYLWGKFYMECTLACMCLLLAGLCLLSFSWPMKAATTKANQEIARARHAGLDETDRLIVITRADSTGFSLM